MIQRGRFTLIEALIVLLLISTTVFIIISASHQRRRHPDSNKCRSQLKQLGLQVASYFTNTSIAEFPTNWLSNNSPMQISTDVLTCPVTNSTYKTHRDSLVEYTGSADSPLALDRRIHLKNNDYIKKCIVFQDGHVEKRK